LFSRNSNLDEGETEMNTEMLTDEQHRFPDESSATEYCIEQGWTDGLPVILPTPERVRAMLAGGDLPADALLGRIPERRISVRVEQVAINAVMAGCLPSYMPVVLAAVKGLLDPAMGLHGPAASTAGVGFLVIVNGPYASQIGLRNGENLLGPGARANATIGRAIRLLLINAGGDSFDRATLGHPGKYSYCVAEQEGADWEPLHTLRGFAAHESAVTVMAAEGPNQVNNSLATNGDDLLTALARRMIAPGSSNVNDGGNQQMVVIICPEHRRTLQAEGWSKVDVRHRLWEKARISLAERKRSFVAAGAIARGDEDAFTPVTPSPEDLLILTAGGTAGRFSAVIPGWASSRQCRAVSVKITGVEG